MTEVLAWLAEHHPDLHKTVEVDRAWLWITADLKGEHNKAIRDAINHEGGFRFAKRGHALPSGKIAFWGHSCSRPIAFKRTGKLPGASAPATRKVGGRPDPLATGPQPDEAMEALAAAFV